MIKQIFQYGILFCLWGAWMMPLGAQTKELPVIEAELTFAPNVPPPVARDYPARVIVRLESQEYKGELSKGVEYEFWGYNGHVPGPFIRIREGDTVEFHFKNAQDAKNTHTIDFHAMTGPCGAACLLLTEPGKETVVQAKAINPGLFVYHCAAPPIPVHIANGLYGLVLVEPKEGLSKADREYYVMQSEFYTEGAAGTKGLVPFSSQKGMEERPTYVVFNGKVGALMGEGALSAQTNETVRLYVGNIGPNLISSFHVIGEIFDRVYQEGSLTSAPLTNVQTTLVPAGGVAVVEFKVEVPGDFTLVDHSIFRINKGAVGILHVEGPENPEVLKRISVNETEK
ncbi:MAG: nitrite reductase, copper-containing [Candidatus Omnitrophica bacterium]|nr:nitrite reductase, copper-containing [Candidatus Omnitrophota bacterium]